MAKFFTKVSKREGLSVQAKSKVSWTFLETAFQHAVYKCDEPEIPALFLSAAGEKLLDSDIVHVRVMITLDNN